MKEAPMNRGRGILVILCYLIFHAGIRAQQPAGGGHINEQLLEAAKKRDNSVEGLLARGANANAKTNHGSTALMAAAENSRQAAAQQSPANETGPLFRVEKDGKYGYIDKTGKVVIPIQYDSAGPFSEGLAPVVVDAKLVDVEVTEYGTGGAPPVKKVEKRLVGGKYGYIDSTGKMVIPPYDYAGEFSEGLAMVAVGGEWISHGTISLHGGGKFGYIDKTGRILIKPQYSQASSFSEGLARVAVGGKWAGDLLVGEKWGYIDKTGKLVIPAKYEYDDHTDFSEGLALAKIGKKYGYIDKTGKVVIPPQYDSADKFSEGLAAVEVGGKEAHGQYSGGKWGFIDKTGTIVLAPQYDYQAEFSEGLAAVSIDGKLGYIDKTGKIVIPLGGEEFSEGLAAAFVPGKDGQKGKRGYIDKTGTIVIQPRFGGAEKFSQGLAEVTVDGKAAYIDHTGNYVWGPTS